MRLCHAIVSPLRPFPFLFAFLKTPPTIRSWIISHTEWKTIDSLSFALRYISSDLPLSAGLEPICAERPLLSWSTVRGSFSISPWIHTSPKVCSSQSARSSRPECSEAFFLQLLGII
jgi:hypothetical protein